MTNGNDYPVAEVNVPRIGIDTSRAGHRRRRAARRTMQMLPRRAELIRFLPFGAGGEHGEKQEDARKSNPHARNCRAG
jgi:hypothetical protein